MDISGVFSMLPIKIATSDYSGKGVDQLQYIINQLKDPSAQIFKTISDVSMESVSIRRNGVTTMSRFSTIQRINWR